MSQIQNGNQIQSHSSDDLVMIALHTYGVGWFHTKVHVVSTSM